MRTTIAVIPILALTTTASIIPAIFIRETNVKFPGFFNTTFSPAPTTQTIPLQLNISAAIYTGNSGINNEAWNHTMGGTDTTIRTIYPKATGPAVTTSSSSQEDHGFTNKQKANGPELTTTSKYQADDDITTYITVYETIYVTIDTPENGSRSTFNSVESFSSIYLTSDESFSSITPNTPAQSSEMITTPLTSSSSSTPGSGSTSSTSSTSATSSTSSTSSVTSLSSTSSSTSLIGATSSAQTTGRGTYYEPSADACGTSSSSSDFVVAIAQSLYDAMGTTNEYISSACGRYITASYQGKSVQVKVVDACASCTNNDLDFSPAAFQKLADLDIGVIEVEWSFDN